MEKQYFGAFLDLNNRLCVVVGGGRLAERKIHSLLACGARVRIISPDLTPGLQELVANGRVEYVERSFQADDTKQAFLTIAATRSSEANRKIAEEVEAEGRWVNTARADEGGNMMFPAMVRKGPLQVAISTSGLGPAAARAIRSELEDYFGDEYEVYLRKLNEIRQQLIGTVEEETVRAEILRRIVQSNVLELLRNGLEAEAERTIQSIIESRGTDEAN
jgi:precorrin-2 dehydrogenase/sirohydrochlorin ferrochelatase